MWLELWIGSFVPFGSFFLSILVIWRRFFKRNPDPKKFFPKKTVIITGASRGIGAEVAYRISSVGGVNLVLAARSKEDLDIVRKKCEAAGSEALVVETDVSCEEDCRNLVDKAVKRFGNIDVLLLNAGVSMSILFEDVDDYSIFKKLMDINYFACVNLTRFALPYIRQSRGSIAVVSSLAGKTCPPFRSGYAASKHALDGFFNVLRCELGKESGVNILLAYPGFVDTGIREHAFQAAGHPGISMENKKMMPAHICAEKLVHAISARKREEYFGLLPWILVLLQHLFPGVVEYLVRKTVLGMTKQKTT